MSGILRRVSAVAVAASLVAVPTGAIAAAPPAPRTAATTAATTQANPWVALSAMTSSSSASSAALRHEEGHAGFPPILPLIVILGTIALAVYILTKDDDDEPLGFPISP
jgi:hypothetical protein